MKSDLPLFPLPDVVLFPGMIQPLHIFEERYQDMMHDIMGVDASFGILLCQEYNPKSLEGIPFDIGTIAEVMECGQYENGHMDIVVIGTERFHVREFYPERSSYLVGDIEILQETPGEILSKGFLQETINLFHDALRLTHKLLKKDYEPLTLPEDPVAISYFIAENLRGSLVLKQKLLEIDSPKARLEYEKDVLQNMVKTLAVRTQIEDIFE